MIKHKGIDEISDEMRELFEVIEMNLKYIPARGLVRNTPLAQINRQLNATTTALIKDSTEIITNVEEALQIDLGGIKETNERNIRHVSRQMRLRSIDKDRKDLARAVQEGIDKQPRVPTKSGRMWGYKEYMEMSIRTQLAHEAGDMMLEAGANAGVVFYICNVFEDCADDHKDYQGKYYYDMRFKEFGYDNDMIEKIIRDKKVLPLQHVRDNKPYLTTRPNCRHTFTPVSIEQVSGISPNQMVKDLKLSTGTYKDAKTKASQEMRYNERQIRQYKQRAAVYERLANEAIDIDDVETYRTRAMNDRRLVRQWQARRRALVKANPHLEYDARRESSNRVVQNLGIEYNLDSIINMAEIDAVAEVVLDKIIEEPKEVIRDIKNIDYTGYRDGFRNKEIRDWAEPAIKKLINDYEELDVLGNHVKFKRFSSSPSQRTRTVVMGYFSSKYKRSWDSDNDIWTISSEMTVEFNTYMFKDLEHIRRSAQYAFDRGSDPTPNEYSTIAHELAHVIDFVLSAEMVGLDLDLFDKKLSRKEHNDFIKKFREAQKLPFSKSILDEFRDINISKEISSYAGSKTRDGNMLHYEVFAEAFVKHHFAEERDEIDKRFEKWFNERKKEVYSK